MALEICQDDMVRGRDSCRTYIKKRKIFISFADVETCN